MPEIKNKAGWGAVALAGIALLNSGLDIVGSRAKTAEAAQSAKEAAVTVGGATNATIEEVRKLRSDLHYLRGIVETHERIMFMGPPRVATVPLYSNPVSSAAHAALAVLAPTTMKGVADKKRRRNKSDAKRKEARHEAKRPPTRPDKWEQKTLDLESL